MNVISLSIQAVERELDQTAALSGPIREVCRYAMEGGRRTRGMLLLGAAQQSGPRAIRAAAAIEMIHAATLLQDDIFDAGELRRGRLVAHLRFGKPLAILASDWLLIRALELAAGVDPQFFRCLARAGTSMVQAEASELSPVPLRSVKQAEACGSAIAEGKTAALFGTALCGAAVLRGLCPEDRSRWEDLGVQMGITYQWVDDCIDLYGTETAAGKTVGHDLAAGCLTLPVLLAALRLEQQEMSICLQDLQAGHLPPPELKRLYTALHSTSVMQQVNDLLQDRLRAHRKGATGRRPLQSCCRSLAYGAARAPGAVLSNPALAAAGRAHDRTATLLVRMAAPCVKIPSWQLHTKPACCCSRLCSVISSTLHLSSPAWGPRSTR